jgi:aminoglycoside phosphotransferase (APT) family kinase protein
MAPFLAGDSYWRAKLAPLGVPVAKELSADLSATVPYVILERVPGNDLGNIYGSLSSSSKRSIAEAVVDAQSRTVVLPEALAFGYAHSYEDARSLPCQRWEEVILSSFERSRIRIIENGLVDTALVDRVSALLPRFSSYFACVRPAPFLHDATTKNVIVHNGQLSGIVDLDEMGFGDPLLAVGLTQTALRQKGFDTEYIDHWLAAVNATAEQRAVVDFYSAVFCVDFLSEEGQLFNRDEISPDLARVSALKRLLDALLERL